MYDYGNTVKLEIFIVKIFRSQWWLRKLSLRKLVRTINANVVRGRSYELFLHKNLPYESFFTRKFPDLWHCIMTVIAIHQGSFSNSGPSNSICMHP